MSIEPIRKSTPKVRERKSLRSKPHTVPSRVREDTFARDDYLCQWCRVPGGALHPHHRFLRAQGGRDSVHVLVTVHALCHDAIHTTQIIEAKRRRFIVSTEAGLSEPWT